MTAVLATVAVLATMVVLRRDDFLGVVLAILVVLLAMTSGVAVDAARHQPPATPVAAPPQQVTGGLRGIDADTLETLDDPMMVAALRARLRDR